MVAYIINKETQAIVQEFNNVEEVEQNCIRTLVILNGKKCRGSFYCSKDEMCISEENYRVLKGD